MIEIHMEPSELAKLRPIAVEARDQTATRSDPCAKAVQMLRDYLATKGILIKRLKCNPFLSARAHDSWLMSKTH